MAQDESKLRRLVLPCSDRPADIMSVDVVKSGIARPGPRVLIEIADEDDHARDISRHRNVVLTDEGARLLFNWLGVYLHTR